MTAIQDILKQVPIGQLANQVGASEADTTTAATHVIQSLLGGMSANVADGGEGALTSALQAHTPSGTTAKTAKGTKTTAKGVDITSVDTADGAKIVQHVLGTDPSTAAAAVATKTGTDSNLISKLMPILAPVVMTYLASKMSGGSAGKTAIGAGLGGVLGNVLGGVLGGGGSAPAQTQQSSSGGLGDLLGGLLGKSVGSGNSASGSGGLGGLLSNLF